MENKPTVSAVVTTYKRRPEIVKRALQSIIAQTYKRMDAILVNDYPEDKKLSKELQELCDSFEPKVRYLQMTKNSGANAARNYGASKAKGEYIGFLDDDDEWNEKKIELQLKKMVNSDVGIVYCNVWINSEKSHNTTIHYKEKKPEGDLYAKLFHRNVIGSTSFPLIRKAVFDEVGGFDESVPALQDMELWLRITQKYSVGYVHEPLGTYYFYLSDRISAHPERRIKGYEIILEKHKDYLKQNKKVKADFDNMGVTLYINGRDFRTAMKLWLEAVRFNPLNVKENAFMGMKIIIRFFIKAKIV